MDQDLTDQLIATLGGGHGWLAALLSWMGTSRIVFKLFSGHLEDLLEALVKFFVANKDAAAIATLNRVLGHWTYRLLAFLADYIASIKLPLQAAVPPVDQSNAAH